MTATTAPFMAKRHYRKYDRPDVIGIQAKVVGYEVRWLHSTFGTEAERDAKLKELRKRK